MGARCWEVSFELSCLFFYDDQKLIYKLTFHPLNTTQSIWELGFYKGYAICLRFWATWIFMD